MSIYVVYQIISFFHKNFRSRRKFHASDIVHSKHYNLRNYIFHGGRKNGAWHNNNVSDCLSFTEYISWKIKTVDYEKKFTKLHIFRQLF